ncbi:hypothetical protein RZS08_26235 [Arthrospira platensis SPKY1]|nr:hypothetical protein [Arthrospira platensis SPKY1]
MTIWSYPADEHHYREQTAGQAKFAGVMLPSFVCGRCNQVRAIKGRKKIAARWWCAYCHQAREYARAAKAAQKVRA